MTILAFAALLAVVYTYVGYPLLIAVWSRLSPFRVAGSDALEPTVSICLPAYNGEPYLVRKLQSLQAQDYPADKLEILVFSDGSTDGTETLVREMGESDPRIRLVSSPERLGKPTALNRLRAVATGDVLVLCDVRQPMSPNAVRALVRELADPAVGCVSGSLVLEGGTGAGMYWRYEHAIRRAESRLGGMVGVSGSIYALRRGDMPELPTDVLLDDMFVPLHLALATGKRIVLADSAVAFDVALDDEHEFSRKVRTLAGNYQLVRKMPLLLVPWKNPMWLQMISHKMFRLLCPWALLLLLATSGVLAHGVGAHLVWQALFYAQVAFYLLAAVGSWAGRVGSTARTFVVLNAAAVVGLWRFSRGSQAVTW